RVAFAGRRGGGVGGLLAAGANQLIGGVDELVVTGNERQAHGHIGQHGNETGAEIGGGLEHGAGDGLGRLDEGACVLGRSRFGGDHTGPMAATKNARSSPAVSGSPEPGEVAERMRAMRLRSACEESSSGTSGSASSRRPQAVSRPRLAPLAPAVRRARRLTGKRIRQSYRMLTVDRGCRIGWEGSGPPGRRTGRRSRPPHLGGREGQRRGEDMDEDVERTKGLLTPPLQTAGYHLENVKAVAAGPRRTLTVVVDLDESSTEAMSMDRIAEST